jgi:hypothetical protein
MKNKALGLPSKNRDIQARLNRRCIAGAIITALWCVAVCAVIAIYDGRLNYYDMLTAAAMTATIAVPIFLFRPYRIIFERNWQGVVKSVVRKNKPQGALISFLDRTADVIVPVITLSIERSDGKTIIKQYRLKKDEVVYAEALALYYSAGTVVQCYKGTKYLKKEDNAAQINGVMHRLCIVCGNFGDFNRAECRHCKSTFVD